MAITPRSFFRNPLLLILAILGLAGAAFASGLFCAPCHSRAVHAPPPNVAQQSVRSAVATASEASAKGWLGVKIRTLTPALAHHIGEDARLRGVLIEGVLSHMPAQRAGFQRGDVVTHFAGKRLTSACQLKSKVMSSKPGTRATVRIVRNGRAMILTPVLTKAPSNSCGK
jgi:S1-C subfamily serine protease